MTTNLEQTNQQLNALAPSDGAFFTFATIKGKTTRHFHGTLEQHASQLTNLNERGAGVYVTVNQTDGKRRKAENITAIRALFVDFDTVNHERVSELFSLEFTHDGYLPPSMIVESSTGKHHAYWIANNLPLDKFSEWQKRLIGFFESVGDSPDKAIHDLPRVMRLAGFYHNKGEPFLSKVIYPNEGEQAQRYTLAEIEGFIDSLPANGGQTSQTPVDDFMKDEPLGLSVAEIKHYLRYVADNADYDTWLKIGMALHHEFKGSLDGLDVWNDWSETAHNYAGYDELAGKWQTFDSEPKDKPTTAKTLIHMAKQNANFEPYKPDLVEVIEIIAQLATLDETHYQLQRKDKAKALGLTPTSLDKAVYAERKKLGDINAPEIVSDTAPYGEAVDGDLLAGEIYQLINAHIACDDSIAVAVTLWIFFTWCIDVAYIAPIAWINAPEKRCGKTTLATLIGRLSKRTLSASNLTTATLFRAVDKYAPTLIIDEADTFIGDNEELRGIINAGFSRDNPYTLRLVGDGHELKQFFAFGARVISGIGKLHPTMIDRAISFKLSRKLKSEKKTKLRNLPSDVTDTAKAKLSRWADDNMQAVKNALVEMPPNIDDRAEDKWEILFKVACVIGGDWLQKCNKACLDIEGLDNDTPSVKVQLLTDIKAVFELSKMDRLATGDLIGYLIADDEMMWQSYNRGKHITPKQIAKHLGEFGIKSKPLRIDGEVSKGYDKKDFLTTFLKYLS